MSEIVRGRVIQVDAKVVHVDVGHERVVQAALRGALFEERTTMKNPTSVGDFVAVDLATEPASVEAVEPRRNHLGRVASSHDPREQVLVANVDQLLCIGSVKNPGFSSNRTDRILVACGWHDIPTVLVLNKVDLVKGDRVAELRATYAPIPVPVLATSATTGAGLEELAARLAGKVTVLYGPSGAGKSTLINKLQPHLKLREGRISSYWAQGKHTTAFSRMFPLRGALAGDGTGYVIDTPGIRVFRPYGLKRADLRHLFPDFAPFQARCEYSDCTHDHEPGCAVADAVEAGDLPATRYASYVEILDEIDPEGAYDPIDNAPPGDEIYGDG
ncbi:MAG: ribosome small subunit-dependent GTPase A [Planctomycetota bacterium]